MKKYLAFLLILLPLLTGCMNQEPDQSQSTTLPNITLPPAYYEENSQIETATDGAVKQFSLPGNGYSGIFRVANGILVATNSDVRQLQMLNGETCIPGATVELKKSNLQQCVSMATGFAYYDQEAHSVVYLDANLNQKHRVALSADMTTPVISPDGSAIFGCVGQEIRALDVEKNISRLIKSQGVAKQELLGTCFDGSVLICATEDEAGKSEILYISSKDGQTLKSEAGIDRLYSDGENYLAAWTDGGVFRWVCGVRNDTAQHFIPKDPHIVDAMELGGVVGYSVGETGLELNFYRIPEAIRTASVLLPGIGQPEAVMADAASESIWLIAEDTQRKEKVLLRWTPSRSACVDDAAYGAVLYTVENPDQEALKALQSRVDALNTKHGVRIRIWQEAVNAPGEHILVPEYQPDTISNMLDQLEAVLDEFPKSFVSKSISSRVRICLVRSVDGAAAGTQYWEGRYALIALCSGTDIREEFLKGFGFVVDSHVLGNSPIYDYWGTLNPTGFQYGKPDEAFLAEDNRYFVDMDSMNTAMTDRSRVFWQAMVPDNGELFKNEAMQKKLVMLCKAIRDAWGLEKKSDVYPWEQYLEESIAYKK